MPSKRASMLALAVLLALGGARVAVAQDRRVAGPTPPRLAFTEGEVAFWRPGAEDWSPAQVNTPLAAGDALYAGSGGRFEVELAARAFVRGGSRTELGIESIEQGYLQLKVTAGRAALDLQRLPEGQRIEVDTPNGVFVIDRSGYYSLDVGDDTTRLAVRRGGEAMVIPAGGDSSIVPDGRQVVLKGTETAIVTASAAPGPDAWDRWNDERTGRLAARPRSAEYVPRDVAGADDLDQYGDWRQTTSYGPVWVPRAVPAGWAPYSTGRWVYDPYYDWTWVDDAPWGWAPYHYGRWVHQDSYWGWAPGPLVSASIYAPALVGFLGGPFGGVSVGLGLPFVGWVALGFGEPVLPWWGPVGFIGRPYWCGWGGRRYVNDAYVHDGALLHAGHVRTFRNLRVRDAVIGARHDRFGRGHMEHVRLARHDVDRLRPVHGRLDVRPGRESLVPRAGHAKRPPDAIRHRPVVTTRAPRDHQRPLRGAGLSHEARTGERRGEPRIVRPNREHGARTRLGSSRPPVPGRTGMRADRHGGLVATRRAERPARHSAMRERVPTPSPAPRGPRRLGSAPRERMAHASPQRRPEMQSRDWTRPRASARTLQGSRRAVPRGERTASPTPRSRRAPMERQPRYGREHRAVTPGRGSQWAAAPRRPSAPPQRAFGSRGAAGGRPPSGLRPGVPSRSTARQVPSHRSRPAPRSRSQRHAG